MFTRLALLVAGFFSGLVITTLGFAIYNSPSATDVLQNIAFFAEIVTACSIFFAAFTYNLQIQQDTEQKRQKIREAVADQIRMFRKEVLGANNNLLSAFRDAYKDRGLQQPVTLPMITLIDDFTINWARTHHPIEYAAQETMLVNLGDRWPIYTTDVLNALEELSVRIQLHGTLNEDELICIKKSFVQIVEQLLAALLKVSMGDPKMYLGVKNVYRAWYRHVDTAIRLG